METKTKYIFLINCSITAMKDTNVGKIPKKNVSVREINVLEPNSRSGNSTGTQTREK